VGRLFKVPLLLSRRADGTYAVTSTLLPELLVEGATPYEAVRGAHDALVAVFDLYEHLRKSFPATQCLRTDGRPVPFEGVVVRP
jgi:antitoxin HicB